jgi:signal transduction histidine kinase
MTVRPRGSLLETGAPAAALAIFILVITVFASHEQTTCFADGSGPCRRPFDAGAAVLIVVAAGALTWRRRYPVAVMLVVLAATLAYFVLGYANGPIWLALIISYFGAVLYGHRIAAIVTAVIGASIFPWLDYFLRDGDAPAPVAIAGLAAWLLVILASAEILRIRRERAADAVRSREEGALRRASEERLRIARELHDALGHHLSLISVQSGVALHVNEELPEQARTSLTAIKQASGEALAELRSVLEILRQEGERAPRSPTSTLDRLDDLVSQASAAGLEVSTQVDGEVRPIPFSTDVAAFRIVQESLTNVARHAQGATASVDLTYGERDLTVQVDDDGAGSPEATSTGSGKGIVGMRERVGALGGDLVAGPRPGGGFRVRARLPLPEGSAP